MDKEDAEALTNYLIKHTYPRGFSKENKRALRKKAESFTCSNGVLYHVCRTGKQQLVIYDNQERRRIISTMHIDNPNKTTHNGIEVTMRKVSDFYYWRRMSIDIRNFCKTCPECCQVPLNDDLRFYQDNDKTFLSGNGLPVNDNW